MSLGASRQRLVLDGLGLLATAVGFGLVYGLATREAGFSVLETLAMSAFVLAGASQFAAVGFVAQGVPWLAIIGVTALLNARHVFYSAALAPHFQDRSKVERAAMAQVLVDETFALELAQVRRLGRGDWGGYWLAAAMTCGAWITSSVVGSLGGQLIPDPRAVALDVVFPAAMAGLAAGFIAGRRELAAAIAGAGIAIAAGFAIDPAVGIIAGCLFGPAIGMLVPIDATPPAAVTVA